MDEEAVPEDVLPATAAPPAQAPQVNGAEAAPAGEPQPAASEVMAAEDGGDSLSTIGGELLASGSTLLPIKRQRIPRTMPLQIVDADWGTSLSRLRHQLQDESPLYPEGLSSEESSQEVSSQESGTTLPWPGASVSDWCTPQLG